VSDWVAVRNAGVTYGTGTAASSALSDVSADFKPGEISLLMGASGSGKTTLLSILGCFRRPDHGGVTLLGHNLTKCSEAELVLLRKRHIGFVFQFFRLFRALTALENVELGLEVSGLGHQRDLAKAALVSVGLGSKMSLKPDALSGGERQRVAIARALSKNPGIILADEPTAALDSHSGSQVAELIRNSVKERQCVAVIATHDSRLLPIADRVLEMRDGRIVSDTRRAS
jgi:putative ABC transport system ATP-binding protein